MLVLLGSTNLGLRAMRGECLFYTEAIVSDERDLAHIASSSS